MFDSLRTDATRAGDAAPDPDRDAKIEQLLLDGLDCYFAAQYDHAINIWTRALFFDRNHPRARAYIERARRALAERQRESEELLQSGVAEFGRGNHDEARRLIRDAMSRGAPAEEALAVLGRLDRMEPGVARPSVEPIPHEEPHRLPQPTLASPRFQRTSRVRPMIVSVAALAIVAAGWLASESVDWQSLLSASRATPPPVTPPVTEMQPALPLRGETALARARMLAAGGRLHDAIAALDLIGMTDVQKGEADRLRARLQQQLIALTLSTELASRGRAPTEGSIP
jgi:hypothetical protein